MTKPMMVMTTVTRTMTFRMVMKLCVPRHRDSTKLSFPYLKAALASIVFVSTRVTRTFTMATTGTNVGPYVRPPSRCPLEMLWECVVLMQLEPQAVTMPACIKWTNMLVASRFNVRVGNIVRWSILSNMDTLFNRTVLTTQKLAGEISWENRTLSLSDECLDVGSMPS